MDRRVQRVISYMKEDLCREVPFDVMARSVNLSPSRLRYLFKAETGMAPAHYLKHLRLQKAKELAENTFLNVKQIMNELGIRDESHFVRDFKRAYGLTPSKYRMLHSNSDSGAENREDEKRQAFR